MIEALHKEKIDEIVKNAIEVMARDGLRTICVAYRDFPHGILIASLNLQ